jgi:Fe-coproporphyrin III synthase
MCNTWQHPTNKKDEIGIDIYEKLPFMDTVNVTGGEAFLREDIDDVINVLKKKTKRLVISSNGFFTDRILKLFSKHKDIGIRISIEGLPKANDELRGLKDGFERGIRTLIELHHMGIKDIGFGITISDRNAKDMIELYHLAKMMGVEFATAAVHNAFYFHKMDNKFEHPDVAIEELKKLIAELLKSNRIKDWFRAYFNYGLINYIKGAPRLLPCDMGRDSFFLEPDGRILPCNILEEGMGNIKEKSFNEIWSSERAGIVRKMVKGCNKNCWMISSASQPMKNYIWKPGIWIIKHKFLGHEASI